ncbi:MAG: hypothetical protein A2498_09305 [Lentisphaerae bacterium RIFOXYC12_FULL_60_16]|nr:MAG: hypothetical protein A2498_09305 [Lentisphaerae bacterium RIFOXYC12_FULL_60_16]
MRIAWVIGAIGHGGVLSVSVAAAEAVAASGRHAVFLVALHRALPDFVPPRNVQTVVLNLPFERLAAGRGFLQWLAKHPMDVVLSNDASNLEPAWSYFPPQVTLIPVLHEIGEGWWRGMVQQADALDGVITVSRFVEDALRRNLSREAFPIWTILNGTQTDRPVPVRQPGKPLRLLYAGGNDPMKGIHDLPRIVRELVKLRVPFSLCLVGSVDPDVVQGLARLIDGDRLELAGHLPRPECLKRMEQADLLLMPSRAEPFGMITVEAMVAGCVPLAYDMPSGTREIVAHGETGFLVTPGSGRAVARIVVELDADRERLAMLSLHASRVARSRFSASRMGMEYESCLKGCRAAHDQRGCRRKPADALTVKRYRYRGWWWIPKPIRIRLRRWAEQRVRLAGWVRAHRG